VYQQQQQQEQQQQQQQDAENPFLDPPFSWIKKRLTHIGKYQDTNVKEQKSAPRICAFVLTARLLSRA
jgi:hypothetical protein